MRVFRAILLCAAAIFTVWVFWQLERDRVEWGQPSHLIPRDVRMAVMITGYSDGTGQVASSPAVEYQTPAAQQALSVLRNLDSLFAFSPDWNALLRSPEPQWIVFPDAAEPLEWCLILGLPRGGMDSIPRELIRGWLGHEPVAASRGGNASWHSARGECAVAHDCLLLARRAGIVESFLERAPAPGAADWKDAVRVASADVPVHLIGREGQTLYSLDLPFRKSRPVMSGYAFPDSAARNPLPVAEGSFGFAAALPADVRTAEIWRYPDRREDRQPESSGNGAGLPGQRPGWDALGDSCQCDLHHVLVDWQSGEAGVFTLPDSARGLAVGRIYGVRDSLAVRPRWSPLIADSAELDGVRAYRLRYSGLFLPDDFPGWTSQATWWIFRKGYVIGIPDLSLVRFFSGSDALSDMRAFRSALEALQPAGGRLLYMNRTDSPRVPALLKAWADPGGMLVVHERPYESGKYAIEAWTPFTGEPTVAEGAGTTSPEWTAELPGQARAEKWWVVRNHLSGAGELLVQDSQHALHLMSDGGQILWSRQLSSPVLGSLRQVDGFRNGKLQYAFATADGIYLVDRNGRDVEGFPVKGSAQISSPLLVVDYDGTRNYRFIAGCSNGDLLNYNSAGEPTPGWQPPGRPSAIRAILHFRLGREDYLLSWDVRGVIHLLRRNGEERARVPGAFTDWNGRDVEVIRGPGMAQTRLAYVRNTGGVAAVYLESGRMESMGGQARGEHVAFADLNGDSKPDVLIAGGTELRAFDGQGEQLFGMEFSSPVTGAPRVYPGTSGTGWVSVSLGDGACHLIDYAGRNHVGFPLASCGNLVWDDFNGDGARELISISGGIIRRQAPR